MAAKPATKRKPASKARTPAKGKRTQRRPGKGGKVVDRSAAAQKAAKTRARNALARAKAEAEGRSNAAVALRDQAVLACLDAGWTQQQAAAELGVDVRTVRRARERVKAEPSPLDARPMALVEGRAKALARSARTYRIMAYQVQRQHPHVALGALKAADAVEARLDSMLTEIGKLPDDLSALRGEAEIAEVVGDVVDGLARLKRGEVTVDGLLEALEVRMSPEGLAPDVPPAWLGDGGGDA